MRYLTCLLALAAVPALSAQPRVVHLAPLLDRAAAADARAATPDLLAEATRLRLAALQARWLPQVRLSGQATYQNDAPTLPFALPGTPPPTSPLDRFQAQAEVQQMLYDGGQGTRQAAVERAALAEAQAGVAVSLYALRQATAEAYFAALLAATQADVLALHHADLTARLDLLKARVAHGAALPADTAALAAERLRAEQAGDEARALHHSALAVLTRLTGTPLTPGDSLAVPDAQAPMPDVLDVADRPELERLAHTQARLTAEGRLARAVSRPQVTLFGQAGVGRPSPFQPFGDAVEAFGLVGVRLTWAVFDGGRAQREAAARAVQARTVAYEAEAFRAQVLRDVEDDRADLDRLDAALVTDRRVVALREEVLRVATRQFEEGVLLPVDYADRLTDLTEARLTWARHRIERARAAVRLALALGQPLQTP